MRKVIGYPPAERAGQLSVPSSYRDGNRCNHFLNLCNHFQRFLCLLFYFVHLAMYCKAQGTGFVTLKGKQFYDENGDDYFPMVMNYRAIIVCDDASNPTGFKVIRDRQYGTTECVLDPASYFNFTNCEQSIGDDFGKMKDMGFNAVRFLLQFNRISTLNSPAGFSIDAVEFNNNGTNNGNNDGMCFSPRLPFVLGPTNYNTQDAQTYFNLLSHVLDIADAHDMKIIFLCANGSAANFPEMGSSAADAADYAAYLSAMATVFKYKPALLAYDLYNEPNYQWYQSGKAMNINKEKVCEYVAQWYDAIKTADPNHLVTIGGTNHGDVFSWDPSVMKIDFVSMHPYPFPDDVFKAYDPEKTEEVLNTIAWFGSELQIPWIIGETGLNSNDETCLQQYMWGNNNDQKNYLEAVLNASRDCGASGFSWWDFQDGHYYCTPPEFCSPTCQYCNDWQGGCGSHDQFLLDDLAKKVNFNYTGLLLYADPDNSGNYASSADKPAVAITQAFDPNAIASCVAPTVNYYNPHQYPPSSGTISGTVTDQNGNPIKNAVIFYRSRITPPSPAVPFKRNEYTYTDANGMFYLIPAPNQASATTVEDLYISACGAERIFRNPVINNQTYQLKKSIINYDASITNQTVSTGNTKNFEGWNSLTTANITIQSGGTSDFTARSEVHINTEFHAAAGSEVHIYTSDVFPDCPDYNNYSAQGRYGEGSAGTDSLDESANGIEIYFKKPIADNSLSVIPNPSGGKFLVWLNSSDAGSFIQCIAIYDIIGKEVYLTNGNIRALNIDLSAYTKGIYFLKANDAYKNYNQKIILH